MSRRLRSDRPLLWLIRQPQGLVPASEFDLDYVRQYQIGARLTATITQPKDERLLRFFHAMVAVVAEATGETPGSLKNRLKLRAKLIEGAEIFDGATHIIPRSLMDLDQAELLQFVEQAKAIIATEIVPGVDIEAIMTAARRHAGLGGIDEPAP